MTRRDRIALRTRDTGADDATVYLATTRCNSNRATYHDDPDCQYRWGDGDAMARAEAKQQWAVPCKWCVLGGDG